MRDAQYDRLINTFNVLHNNWSTRWSIILSTTILGMMWLSYKGPMPVIRITSLLQENVPLWYMLSAFPVLGMLLADFIAFVGKYGLERRAIELGLQIGFLVLMSNLRLAIRLPISGHALLFAYVLLRRLCINIPSHSTTKVEIVITFFFYVVTGYVKLCWWTDPITLSMGTIIAGGLTCISFYVLKDYRHHSYKNKDDMGEEFLNL